MLADMQPPHWEQNFMGVKGWPPLAARVILLLRKAVK